MCSNAPRAINNWPSTLFMFIELKNMCGWRRWYIRAWAWDAHILNCNQFNPQLSWYKQLLKPVVNITTSLLFCVWFLREKHAGEMVWQHHKKQSMNLNALNPICLKRKYNLVNDHSASEAPPVCSIGNMLEFVCSSLFNSSSIGLCEHTTHFVWG